MLQRLAISPAQVIAINTYEELVDEMRQVKYY